MVESNNKSSSNISPNRFMYLLILSEGSAPIILLGISTWKPLAPLKYSFMYSVGIPDTLKYSRRLLRASKDSSKLVESMSIG